MINCREILAKKRHIATILFAYVIILLVVLGTYLGRTNSGSSVFGIVMKYRFDFQDENKANGGVTVPSQNAYPTPRRNSVAIGGGITSKGSEDLSEENIETTMSLFTVFLPSFCETASPGFDYRFYFAYDFSDRMFTNQSFLSTFQVTFMENIRKVCTTPDMMISLHMVKCRHNGKPTWAQNDAMVEAYLDNVEYYYRINDDTKMITKNWTEMFIKVLRDYVPENVGVVGPKHFGGNINILTYDFVHMTHLDIFGFYYPRLFTDWWGDDWITRVYQPFRSTKHQDVKLEHTMGKGRRYQVNNNIGRKLVEQVAKDKATLQRFINYTKAKDLIGSDGKKVISMSLYGRNPVHLLGAIRNAQIAPIFFPGWKLRVYVLSSASKAKSLLVPQRILNKLKHLGAEIIFVMTESIPPIFWRYLVIDDSTIDYFIIRNAQSRLCERDSIAVNDWLRHQNPNSDLNALHGIRDHPKHTNLSIVDGLWGGNRAVLVRLLNKSMTTILEESFNSTNSLKLQREESKFLSETLWPRLSQFSYNHDSVSFGKWPGTQAVLNLIRQSGEFLGQEFDQHHIPTSTFSAEENPLTATPS